MHVWASLGLFSTFHAPSASALPLPHPPAHPSARSKRLKEDVVRFYASEVLLALQYLHVQGYVYR